MRYFFYYLAMKLLEIAGFCIYISDF